MSTLSVMTWNVAGRTTRLGEQIDRVLVDCPDLVCLQEITPNALARWTPLLQRADYQVAASAVTPDASRAHRGVLVASRLPMTVVGQKAMVPWPERLMVVDVQPADWSRTLRVVCLYAPLSTSPDHAKTRTFEAVSAGLLALDDQMPAILCGDLNTPRDEATDGTIRTFGQTAKGRMRARVGVRQDLAERRILNGPDGWNDAFRGLHGYQKQDRSWKSAVGGHPGYRLDHILLSANLKAVSCSYDHGVRDRRLSDHSAMYATITQS